MSGEYQPSSEFERLLTALADGELEAADRLRLNETIRDDEDARQFYLHYIKVHSLLIWRHGSIPPLDVSLGEDEELLLRPGRNFSSMAIAIAVVASVVVAVGIGYYNLALPGQASARLTHSEDASWHVGAEPTLPGGRVAPSEAALASGFVQLELPSGVVIAMQGPVRFEWSGENKLRLLRGRIRASVPPAAVGFVVEAPNVQIQDLGTEFGVAVDQWNNVEVQVFQGKVIMNGQITVRKDEAQVVDNKHRKAGAPLVVRPAKPNQKAFPTIRTES